MAIMGLSFLVSYLGLEKQKFSMENCKYFLT